MGMEKSRSLSNGDRGEGSAVRPEDNLATAMKISSTSVSDDNGPSGSMGDRRTLNSKNFEQPGDFSEGDGVQGVTHAQSYQKEQVTVKVSGACDGNNGSLPKLPCEI